MTQNLELSSRPAPGGDGGNVTTQAGSPGTVTQYNSGAKNVIRFPSGFLPDSRASERELSMSDEACAACALAVLFAGFITAIGLLLFAGYEIFGLFDLG